MTDCSKTVEFLREFGRMCGNRNCQECPIWREKATATPCVNYIQNHQAEVLTIVQKWSDEHPVMTWAGMLRDLIPDADVETIIHLTCPKHYFGDRAPQIGPCLTAEVECEDCWDGEYKEAEDHG